MYEDICLSISSSQDDALYSICSEKSGVEFFRSFVSKFTLVQLEEHRADFLMGWIIIKRCDWYQNNIIEV